MSNKLIYQEEWLYPSSAFLVLTNDCNLKCRYCFVEQHPDYMSFETAKKTADWLYSNLSYKKKINKTTKDAKALIIFFGGEPLLQYNTVIKPLIEYNKQKYPNSFNYSITTNGILLTEDKLKFLSENNVAMLQSIDGDKKTQDYNRPCKDGSSSFDIIQNNIPNILKYYPKITFRSTIIPATVNEVFHNYLFAESQGYINCFMMPNNREKWDNKDIIELKKQINFIFYYRLKQFQKGILPSIQMSPITQTFELILKSDLHIFENLQHRTVSRCGLGTYAIAVGYDEKLYGCQEQPSKELKNIFLIGDLTNGIDKEKHLYLLNKYYNSPENKCVNTSICTNCILKMACNGYNKSCPSTDFDLFHNFYQKAEIQCIWEQEFYKNCLTIMQILTNEKNKLFEEYLRKICNYNDILNISSDKKEEM